MTKPKGEDAYACSTHGVSAVNERELALEIVMSVAEEGEYSHIILRNVLNKYQYLEKQQRAFITRVSEGTIEYMLQLDAVLNHFSKTPVKKMKPLIRNLLRISVYQILYMDNVPDSAVCNEAVKLAQKRGFHGLKGFVNGVLRNIGRDVDNITFSTMSEEYSMPGWMIEEWKKEYPNEIIERMLKEFLLEKRTSIRCNTARVSPQKLRQMLEREGVTVNPSPYMEEAFEIANYDTLYSLEAFQRGFFQVQDASSMFVARAASPKAGDYIIDICASPGGKALHLAELLQGSGMVEARDLTEFKVSLIEENIIRNQMKNIRAVRQDALQYDETSVESADIVIADVPCSGFGVIGKKPDIKYRMTTEKIEELQKLQRDILHTIHTYPKKGGVLLYSTCTISRKENLENVEWFIKHYPYELVSLENCISRNLEVDTKREGYMQLLPGIHKTDGFFMAKLRRKG